VPPSASTTTDTLLGGGLRLVQPKTGYRVNIDSLLLVDFAGPRRVERLLDLGAGVGAVALLALERGLARTALLIEADATLVALARENLRLAGFEGEARELDLTKTRLRESALPLILCNPPYFPAHSHRPALTAAKARARSGELAPFLAAASGALARKTGRALFSYPAPQLPELLQQAERVGLVAKRLRFVHARVDQPARLVLIELRAARAGGLSVEPPLVEWIGGKRSPELARLSAGRANDRR
jgi:tRNA1Val (adenine37-N6)-methyltransferase